MRQIQGEPGASQVSVEATQAVGVVAAGAAGAVGAADAAAGTGLAEERHAADLDSHGHAPGVPSWVRRRRRRRRAEGADLGPTARRRAVGAHCGGPSPSGSRHRAVACPWVEYGCVGGLWVGREGR